MAFLRITKEYHSNKPIDVQLRIDAANATAEESGGTYSSTQYLMKATNVGKPYNSAPSKNGDVYSINTGQTFDFYLTEALWTKMFEYKKGDIITVEFVTTKDRPFWRVDVSENKIDSFEPEKEKNVTDLPYGYNSVNDRDAQTQLRIAWGMAFNNATKIACSPEKPYNFYEKVEVISKLTPKMFEIAIGLSDYLESKIPKEQPKDAEEPENKEESENKKEPAPWDVPQDDEEFNG
tara:strand:+ start:614 stop:1318 length:705 start_codon:yes stop_codon:yes gene_type:complete